MSEFYTNVQIARNNVLVRGIDDNGNPFKNKIKFQPTLFYPDPSGTRESMDGTKVKELSFASIKDAKDFFVEHKDVQNIYGNTRWQYQYITNTYSDDIVFDPELIRVLNIDIEVASEDGFPNPTEALQPITAIGIKDSRTENYYVFGLGDYKTSRKDIIYFKCKNEELLLKSFILWMEDMKADVITGWNVKYFDLPYIINRAIRLGIEYKKMSPWGSIHEGKTLLYGKESQYYNIVGVSILDYLILYKKYILAPRESYRLDFIGYIELGLQKLTNSEQIAGYNLYKTNYQKFIDYNIRDIEIVNDLDKKLNLLNLVFAVAYRARINYEDVSSPVRTWDNLITNYLWKRNIVI